MFGAARYHLDFYFKNLLIRDHEEHVLSSEREVPARARGGSSGTELWEPVQLTGSSPEAFGIPELPVPPAAPPAALGWGGAGEARPGSGSGRAGSGRGAPAAAGGQPGVSKPQNLLGLKISPVSRHERLHGKCFHENTCSKPLGQPVVLQTRARPAR